VIDPHELEDLQDNAFKTLKRLVQLIPNENMSEGEQRTHMIRLQASVAALSLNPFLSGGGMFADLTPTEPEPGTHEEQEHAEPVTARR